MVVEGRRALINCISHAHGLTEAKRTQIPHDPYRQLRSCSFPDAHLRFRDAEPKNWIGVCNCYIRGARKTNRWGDIGRVLLRSGTYARDFNIELPVLESSNSKVHICEDICAAETETIWRKLDI